MKFFEGEVLTVPLCTKIEGELIRRGLYTPLKGVSEAIHNKWIEGEALSDSEVARLIQANPQNHKEADFDHGWASRFETHFKLARWFGFAYYQLGSTIQFSRPGNLLVEQMAGEDDVLFANDEQPIYLNAFSRYHRQNPFQRVLNHNRPLILLIGLLKELSGDRKFGSVGLARHELPFLGVWKDNDSAALAQFIIDFRKNYGFTPSSEVIFETSEQIQGGWNKKTNMKTITRELPDELLRKLRITGLISLRGNGRFISLNSDMNPISDYLVNNYQDLYLFEDEREYFEYAAEIDTRLLNQSFVKTQSGGDDDQRALQGWVHHFGIKKILSELVSVSKGLSSRDDILKFIPEPVRLEFLAALLLKHTYASAKVIANYRTSDDGLPISHAPGNNADIELYLDSLLRLYEVTLLRGAAQAKNEMGPITRHQEEYRRTHEKVDTIFVAPSIHIDTVRWANFYNAQGFSLKNKTVEEFADSP